MGLRNNIWKKIKKNHFKPKLLYTYQWKKDYPVLYNKERNIAFAHAVNTFFRVVENRDDNFFY